MEDPVNIPQEARESFRILSALGVSATLHALLLLLAAVWIATRSAASSPEPDRRILVTFAPVVESERSVGEVKGVVPFESKDASARGIPEPAREPEPTPAETSPPPQEAAVEERGSVASVPRTEGGASRESTAPSLSRDSDLPGRTDGPPGSGQRAAGAKGDGFDLAQALSRFERAARRASAAPLPPGQGPHRRVFRANPPVAPLIPGMVTGDLEFESGDFDWTEYGRMVHAAILRAWYRRLDQMVGDFEQWAHRRPWDPIMVAPCLAETKRLDDKNSIRFVLERRGQVTGIRLEAASGCPPLDESAQAGLADVVLPPLPSDFPRDQEVVHARFIAIVDVVVRQDRIITGESGAFLGCDSRKTVEDTMRRYLTTLREMGYF